MQDKAEITLWRFFWIFYFDNSGRSDVGAFGIIDVLCMVRFIVRILREAQGRQGFYRIATISKRYFLETIGHVWFFGGYDFEYAIASWSPLKDGALSFVAGETAHESTARFPIMTFTLSHIGLRKTGSCAQIWIPWFWMNCFFSSAASEDSVFVLHHVANLLRDTRSSGNFPRHASRWSDETSIFEEYISTYLASWSMALMTD